MTNETVSLNDLFDLEVSLKDIDFWTCKLCGASITGEFLEQEMANKKLHITWHRKLSRDNESNNSKG